MMLKENSGRPPPRISSRPGTPVGSLLIFTLFGLIMIALAPRFRIQDRKTRPRIQHQTKRKGFSDKRPQQVEQFGDEHDASPRRRDRITRIDEPIERAVRLNLHSAKT